MKVRYPNSQIETYSIILIQFLHSFLTHSDFADAFDNCPFIANILQNDNDFDGDGDVCDEDDDNDGENKMSENYLVLLFSFRF